jgi:hypothetical protein
VRAWRAALVMALENCLILVSVDLVDMVDVKDSKTRVGESGDLIDVVGHVGCSELLGVLGGNRLWI